MNDYDEMGLAPYQQDETNPNKQKEPQHEWIVSHSRGQAYKARGWSIDHEQMRENDANNTLGCMTSTHNRRKRTTTQNDNDTEDEIEDMVCNMTGQHWEDLPFFHYHKLWRMRFNHAYDVVQACSNT